MNHKIQNLILSFIIIVAVFMPVARATAGQKPAGAADIGILSPPDAQSPEIWFPVVRNGFGNAAVKQIFAMAVFKGALYAVASSAGTPITFWRSTDGLQWELVPQIGKDGGPTPSSFTMGVNVMHVYNDQLYVGTAKPSQTDQLRLWRTSDGSTWELVESNGFGSDNNITVMFTATNNVDFYLSTYNFIYKSSNGEPGSWIKVFDPGTHGNGVWSMIEYQGVLYAGGEASSGSAKIFANDGPSGNWRIVVTLDSGPGNQPNTEIGGFVIFNDVLYVGTKNTNGGEFWKRNNANGSWSRVDTRVNNISRPNGLGSADNEKAEAVTVYSGKLYLVMNNKTTGMQIWVTDDGLNWQLSGDARARKPKNIYTHWNNALVQFDGRMYLGTLVASTETGGGEIWAFPGWKAVYLPLIQR